MNCAEKILLGLSVSGLWLAGGGTAILADTERNKPVKSPLREERIEVRYINFVKISGRTYYSIDFETRPGTKIFLRVPDQALGRNIGRVAFRPRDSVPPDGIASAYRMGAEVHAIANVSEENFVAVKRGPGEPDHEVFWRVERERGETFAADAERVAALTAEVQRADTARAADRQRGQTNY